MCNLDSTFENIKLINWIIQNCFIIWVKCNWIQSLLNYIDFMFYNNNFIDVVFKCPKEELPLNNILLIYRVLYKLMLLLCNLDMAICHIILVGKLTNTDTFHQHDICKLTNTV